MSDLITINELTNQTGTTKVQIAYLTKLGLLPKAIKKKINGEMTGCYPKDSLNKIEEIKNMQNQGITLSQMQKTNLLPVQELSLVQIPAINNDFVIKVKPSNFAYLFLGLVIGVLVSTLNTSGLNTMNKVDSLSLNNSVKMHSGSDKSNVYLIAVPKTSLDNLDKTNINYLIKN